MLRTMLKSTIRATVTMTEPHDVGSLTVDADLLDAADLLPGEQVSVVDVTSGARMETYVTAGPRGSGVVGGNGTASGDVIIVLAYGLLDDAEAAMYQPKLVHVDGEAQVAADPPAETADAARLDALLSTEP